MSATTGAQQAHTAAMIAEARRAVTLVAGAVAQAARDEREPVAEVLREAALELRDARAALDWAATLAEGKEVAHGGPR